MLTKKEIDLIPKGFHPNSSLRKVFGKKHGSIVNERTKDGKDVWIVGNRRQRKFRANNPFRELPVEEKETFHSNRIENKKKMNLIGRVLKFFANLLHLKKAA